MARRTPSQYAPGFEFAPVEAYDAVLIDGTWHVLCKGGLMVAEGAPLRWRSVAVCQSQVDCERLVNAGNARYGGASEDHPGTHKETP